MATMSDNEYSYTSGKMSMVDALVALQESLNLIKARTLLDGTGAQLKSASIDLETIAETDLDGSVTVFVVTVTGAAARKETNTISLTLEPVDPIKGLGPLTVADSVETLVGMTAALADVIKAAQKGTATRLTMSESSVTMDLVVSGNAKLEVAAPGFWKSLLEKVGFDASASVATGYISTSSITLNFVRT